MIPHDHSSGRHDCFVDSARIRKRSVGYLLLAAGLALIDGYGRSDDTTSERKPTDVIENSIGMKLALIPAGEFLMGSPVTEVGRYEDERQHVVRITRPFHLSVHEVTHGEWVAVMETEPWKSRDFAKNGDRYPATYVSREDAAEFCRKLTEKERGAGRLKADESYRLPTEAEWEYSCRAGTETRYHFGEGEQSRDRRAGHAGTHASEVGRKPANAWGLFDMHGNVSEWCSDRYDSYSVETAAAFDPQGPSEGPARVVRGGSWRDATRYCRSASRHLVDPFSKKIDLGFRVARGSGPGPTLIASASPASADSAPAEKPGTIITNSIAMKLAYVPAGEFLMGSASSDDEGNDNEKPLHRVLITRPFHLGVHEVTRHEWTEVMGTTPWKEDGTVDDDDGKEGDQSPATHLGWKDATEFCRNLTDRERTAGRLRAEDSYRLPTEAEWEYACRAGSTTRYHFGDGGDSLDDYEWFAGNVLNIGEEYVHVVGMKRANALGLFDMHGNVSEWCSDRYRENYYRESALADPQGPSVGARRALRGGGWHSESLNCRSARRFGFHPGIRGHTIGFRVARGSTPIK